MADFEDMTESLNDIGWKRSEATCKDNRVLYDLAPTSKLQSTYKQREREKENKKKEMKVKTSSGAHAQMSHIQKVETAFLQKVLDAAALSEEAEVAKNTLEEDDYELLEKMEDTKISIDNHRFVRNEELNKLGVFSKAVNNLRANTLYRVELRRRMQPNLLRRGNLENEEVPEQVETLEQKLQHLIENLDAINNPADRQPSTSHHGRASQHAKDADALNKDMAWAAVAGAAAKKANKNSEEVEARRAEAAAAVQGMLERYRAMVEQRRESLVEEQGIDLLDTVDPLSTSLSPEETAAKYRKAIIQGTKKERVEAEEALEAKYKSYDPANTHSLVDKALARVNKVMGRITEQEEQLKRQEAEAAAQALAEMQAAEEAALEETRQAAMLARRESLGQSGGGGGPSGGGGLVGATRTSRLSRRLSTKHQHPDTTRSGDGGVESPKKAPREKTAIEKAREGRSRGSSGKSPKQEEPEPKHTISGQQLIELAKNRQYEGVPPKLSDLVLDEGLSLAEQLQKRLERVWVVLALPVLHKLDMVIKYTSRDMSSQLEAALAVWELGAAAVLAREAALATLMETMDHAHQYKLKGLPVPQALLDEERVALQSLENATVFVLKADVQLQLEFQDTLTYHGVPYAEQKHDPNWWQGSLKLDDIQHIPAK